jgi:hypothetical protein
MPPATRISLRSISISRVRSSDRLELVFNIVSWYSLSHSCHQQGHYGLQPVFVVFFDLRVHGDILKNGYRSLCDDPPCSDIKQMYTTSSAYHIHFHFIIGHHGVSNQYRICTQVLTRPVRGDIAAMLEIIPTMARGHDLRALQEINQEQTQQQ